MNSGSQIKKVIKALEIIILVVILIGNLAVIASVNSSGRDIFEKLPVAMIPVVGSSMEPVLHSGDAVLCYREDFSSLKAGDIIVFERAGDLITHQIATKYEHACITKGTGNEAYDSEIGENQYRTKVLFRIPFLGALWRIGSSPGRFAVFAVLVTMLFFGSDIFSALFEKINKKR